MTTTELTECRDTFGGGDGKAINRHSVRFYQLGDRFYSLDRNLSGVPPFYTLSGLKHDPRIPFDQLNPPMQPYFPKKIKIDGKEHWGDGLNWPKAEALMVAELGKLPEHRLEYLREELRAERISMGELVELQGLAADYKIAPGDMELLEAAGVPESVARGYTGKPQFYECGICGHLHPVLWNGDCRDDKNRFTIMQVEEKYGKEKDDVSEGQEHGWELVPMPGGEDEE